MGVVFINIFTAKDGNADSILAWLDADQLVERAAGCTACRLLKDPLNPATITSIEDWDTAAARNAYVQSIPKDALDRALATLTGQPEGHFYDPV
jgi:quinol monooxygenase YgiN